MRHRRTRKKFKVTGMVPVGRFESGPTDGAPVRIRDTVGLVEGLEVGSGVGCAVGPAVGNDVGPAVGPGLGGFVVGVTRGSIKGATAS